MRLFQFRDSANNTAIGVSAEDRSRKLNGEGSVYEFATATAASGRTLSEEIAARGLGESIDAADLARAGRLLPPITHPDPAHLHLTGTGLTHLGSAATRDDMHRDEGAEADSRAEIELTDSMKMFRLGLGGGKPAPGKIGVQPEWFYKGDGDSAVGPGEPLVSPAFALDGGEEPEIAGIYVIGADDTPFRIGFALSNEFSDHVTERQNYLYLAHSKLRPASFGPEILMGDLPTRIEGMSRIIRDGVTIWEKPFLSGEDCMSHTIANLEYHHFKYRLFRRPGDVHVHMFGTATLSFADGVAPHDGDVFEISASEFGLPLRNPLKIARPENVKVRPL